MLRFRKRMRGMFLLRRSAYVGSRAAGEFGIGPLYAAHLGDSLCLTPLPRPLNTRRGVEVHVEDVALHRNVFANNPHVCGYRRYGCRRMDASVKSKGHIIQQLLRRFGTRRAWPGAPEVYLSTEEIMALAASREW